LQKKIGQSNNNNNNSKRAKKTYTAPNYHPNDPNHEDRRPQHEPHATSQATPRDTPSNDANFELLSMLMMIVEWTTTTFVVVMHQDWRL
jgi:hypothetical protein